jgi:hypothetical protein
MLKPEGLKNKSVLDVRSLVMGGSSAELDFEIETYR